MSFNDLASNSAAKDRRQLVDQWKRNQPARQAAVKAQQVEVSVLNPAAVLSLLLRFAVS